MAIRMKIGTGDSEEMRLFSIFVSGTRRTALPIAGLMIALIAAIDAHAARGDPTRLSVSGSDAGGGRRLDPLGDRRGRGRLRLAGGVLR